MTRADLVVDCSLVRALSVFFASSWLLFACSSDTFSAGDAAADANPSDGGSSDASPLDAATAAVKFREQTFASSQSGIPLELSRPLTAVQGDLAIFAIASGGAVVMPQQPMTPIWTDTNGGCAPLRISLFAVTIGTENAWKFDSKTDSVGAVAIYENGAPDKIQKVQGSSHSNLLTLPLDAVNASPPGSVLLAGAITSAPISGDPLGMTSRFGSQGGLLRGWDQALPTGGPVAARVLTSGDSMCALVFQLVLGKR
jgi:hypothetical protein